LESISATIQHDGKAQFFPEPLGNNCAALKSFDAHEQKRCSCVTLNIQRKHADQADSFKEASHDLHADTTSCSCHVVLSSNAHISSRVQINFITRYGMRQHCFSSSEQYHDIMS